MRTYRQPPVRPTAMPQPPEANPPYLAPWDLLEIHDLFHREEVFEVSRSDDEGELYAQR